jgi:cobalt-zinc-cadmium efflux system membrane fusion protein
MRLSLKWDWSYFRRRWLAAVGAALLLATLIAVTHFSAKADDTRTAGTGPKANPPAASPAPGTDPSVELTDAQLNSIKIGVAAEHAFPQERTAVGSIDFNENLAVQVFSPTRERSSGLTPRSAIR